MIGFPEEGGFWKALTEPSKKVRARLCNDCGNIQLFANSFVVKTESRARLTLAVVTSTEQKYR